MYNIDDFRNDLNKESEELCNFMININEGEMDYDFVKFSAIEDLSYTHRMLNNYIGEPYYTNLFDHFVDANILKKDKNKQLKVKSNLARAILANIALSCDTSKCYRDVIKDMFNLINPHKQKLKSLLQSLNDLNKENDIIKMNCTDFDFVVYENTVVKLIKRSSEESALKLMDNELDINILLGSNYLYSIGIAPIRAYYYEENTDNIFYSGLIVYDNIGQLYNMQEDLSTFNNSSNKGNVINAYCNYIESIQGLSDYLTIDEFVYNFEPISILNKDNNYPYNINYGYLKVKY